MPAEAPAFFSKIFQNFKLSSAATKWLAIILIVRHLINLWFLPAVASICPSGLRQLWRTRLS
jgi:hypothetical protein